MNTFWSRSKRDCSWKKPRAWIISWIGLPMATKQRFDFLSGGCREIIWAPPSFPMKDQHLWTSSGTVQKLPSIRHQYCSVSESTIAASRIRSGYQDSFGRLRGVVQDEGCAMTVVRLMINVVEERTFANDSLGRWGSPSSSQQQPTRRYMRGKTGAFVELALQQDDQFSVQWKRPSHAALIVTE